MRMKLNIQQQPKTGAPMIYPVPLATIQKGFSSGGSQKDVFWSLQDSSETLNVSINQLISDQGIDGGSLTNTAVKLKKLLTQLTKTPNSSSRPSPVSRKRREVSETKIGSRVFLEVSNNGCQQIGR